MKEDLLWLANESMENLPKGQSTKRQLGKFHSWWKRRVAAPISDIDNFVKHVYREHNQEADHWANIGAGTEGERLMFIEEMIPQHGKRYVASGMEASKTMAEADAES